MNRFGCTVFRLLRWFLFLFAGIGLVAYHNQVLNEDMDPSGDVGESPDLSNSDAIYKMGDEQVVFTANYDYEDNQYFQKLDPSSESSDVVVGWMKPTLGLSPYYVRPAVHTLHASKDDDHSAYTPFKINTDTGMDAFNVNGKTSESTARLKIDCDGDYLLDADSEAALHDWYRRSTPTEMLRNNNTFDDIADLQSCYDDLGTVNYKTVQCTTPPRLATMNPDLGTKATAESLVVSKNCPVVPEFGFDDRTKSIVMQALLTDVCTQDGNITQECKSTNNETNYNRCDGLSGQKLDKFLSAVILAAQRPQFEGITLYKNKELLFDFLDTARNNECTDFTCKAEFGGFSNTTLQADDGTRAAAVCKKLLDNLDADKIHWYPFEAVQSTHTPFYSGPGASKLSDFLDVASKTTLADPGVHKATNTQRDACKSNQELSDNIYTFSIVGLVFIGAGLTFIVAVLLAFKREGMPLNSWYNGEVLGSNPRIRVAKALAYICNIIGYFFFILAVVDISYQHSDDNSAYFSEMTLGPISTAQRVTLHSVDLGYYEDSVHFDSPAWPENYGTTRWLIFGGIISLVLDILYCFIQLAANRGEGIKMDGDMMTNIMESIL